MEKKAVKTEDAILYHLFKTLRDEKGGWNRSEREDERKTKRQFSGPNASRGKEMSREMERRMMMRR